MSDLVKYLFETNAFRVCEENKPFWYTSGKIGPFYINTQFLYGSEKEATDLLDYINTILEDKINLPSKVFEKVEKQYQENSIYQYTINQLVNYIKENINIDEVDYISGGERRDWFFSNIVANILNKKHLTIYKDLTVVESDPKFATTNIVKNIENKKVLHVADLVNTASSYTRAWIPVIKEMKGQICWSAVVVDRVQGGKEVIEGQGIKSLALLNLDSSLFETAYQLGRITDTQLELLNNYRKNPDVCMKEFLINHPEFLENALKSDPKTASRAKNCIDNDLYNLK